MAKREQRKRGRPPGTPQSAETRLRISATRREQERARREARRTAPLDAPVGLDEDVRRAITERDGRLCVACREDGPELLIHTFLHGRDDLDRLRADPEAHAVLCRFCRRTARDLGARSAADLFVREVMLQEDPTP